MIIPNTQVNSATVPANAAADMAHQPSTPEPTMPDNVLPERLDQVHDTTQLDWTPCPELARVRAEIEMRVEAERRAERLRQLEAIRERARAD
ncbi:MAG: hypothetical protein JNL67_07515 [Planctomycetaceae bacterium]|nr:hypothetical protein [Planctomycetaceae bacterium]